MHRFPGLLAAVFAQWVVRAVELDCYFLVLRLHRPNLAPISFVVTDIKAWQARDPPRGSIVFERQCGG
jgi:hypothetical protein